ncbi:MAG TPA: class I SAM-dependent methyltransferase [Candidatus Nanopelagicaceae bacterium]|nr:class I SAM-dependent methyltransferase [Candidatus Nanopelagicaceae bacterium]
MAGFTVNPPAHRGDIDAYVDTFISEEAAVTAARARASEVGSYEPSAAVGATLAFLAALVDARNVAESGTGCGVSALWLLRGMPIDSSLTSIDAESEYARLAREALTEAQISQHRVRLITGEPLDVLSRLTDGAYDLVILRSEPRDLAIAVEHAHRLLRAGGVMVIDRALWSGRVPDPAQRDESTIAMRELGKSIRADIDNWRPLLVPMGEGLILAIRHS